MALTSSSGDGIRCTSAAKESAGAASTLGSQVGANANQVIVPDAIGSNNEGNLESTPSYVGRMIAIRPWEMKLVRATVNAGGSGYAVNDVLTLSGGTAGPGGAPQVTVTAVSSGAVTEVSITREASFAIRRGAMTGQPSPPNDSVSVTGGAGTGATFDCIFAPHFELRFITADSSNTLTVHEDWDTAPVSGDNWAVSYILEDYATQTGLTLRSQSGVFEATRRIKVGPSTDGTRHGWLAINDGKAMELDNVADSFEMANGGVFTVGYEQGGVSVNGGYISTSGTNGTGLGVHDNYGAMFFLHDLQIRSPREFINVEDSGTLTVSEAKFRREVLAIIKNAKIFDLGPGTQGSAAKWRDVVTQSNDNTTVYEIELLLDNGNSGDHANRINGMVVIGLNDSDVANFGGFRSDRSTHTASVIFEHLRNITFIDSEQFVTCDQNETFRFVNPVWDPDLTDQRSFEFSSTTGTSIEELMSLIVRPVTGAGEGLADVHGYIYEGTLNDNLPTENTNQSDSAAYDPIADLRFEDEVAENDIVYVTDVLNNVYTPNGTTSVNEAARGGFAWRGYIYGRLPATVPFTANLSGGLDIQVALLNDPAITEATQSTALTNPTTNPTVERHAAGETDTRPMKALNYDAGTGSAPQIGETLTQGSATGVVVDFYGTGTEGTVLVDTWNGTEFTDNQTITGGTSTFSATTDTAGFYEEYTWEVNAQGENMTVVYDYLAARMAEVPLVAPFDDVIIWGGTDSDANQLVYLGADGYFTNRNVSKTEGVWIHNIGTGTLDFFTSDGGTVFNVPQTVTVKLTVVAESDLSVIENARALMEADAGGDLPSDDVVTITRSGSTATVTHTAHGLESGAQVVIRDADQSEYTGIKTITNVTTNTYDFTVSGSPTTPATGTILATAVILNGTTNASGIIQDTQFNYTNDQPYRGRIRKSSGSPNYRTANIVGTINSGGADQTVQLVLDE